MCCKVYPIGFHKRDLERIYENSYKKIDNFLMYRNSLNIPSMMTLEHQEIWNRHKLVQTNYKISKLVIGNCKQVYCDLVYPNSKRAYVFDVYHCILYSEDAHSQFSNCCGIPTTFCDCLSTTFFPTSSFEERPHQVVHIKFSQQAVEINHVVHTGRT